MIQSGTDLSKDLKCCGFCKYCSFNDKNRDIVQKYFTCHLKNIKLVDFSIELLFIKCDQFEDRGEK